MLQDGFQLGAQTGHPAREPGTHQSPYEGSSTLGGPSLSRGGRELPGANPERAGKQETPGQVRQEGAGNRPEATPHTYTLLYVGFPKVRKMSLTFSLLTFISLLNTK